MHSFHHFKSLPTDLQIHHLNRKGVPLDLAHTTKSTEAILFAYNGFYVELVVEQATDEILAIRSFRSTKKLEPYLLQVDIQEIIFLLSQLES